MTDKFKQTAARGTLCAAAGAVRQVPWGVLPLLVLALVLPGSMVVRGDE